MQTLRTRIPHLIQMLMDKNVTVTFSGGFHGPTISWHHKDLGSHTHLDNIYVPGTYEANSIQIEEVLINILANLSEKE